MEITQAQFAQIEHCMPTQRGNVSLSNLSVLNAILYVAEHGCKWRGLPGPGDLEGAQTVKKLNGRLKGLPV